MLLYRFSVSGELVGVIDVKDAEAPALVAAGNHCLDAPPTELPAGKRWVRISGAWVMEDVPPQPAGAQAVGGMELPTVAAFDVAAAFALAAAKI